MTVLDALTIVLLQEGRLDAVESEGISGCYSMIPRLYCLRFGRVRCRPWETLSRFHLGDLVEADVGCVVLICCGCAERSSRGDGREAKKRGINGSVSEVR